MKIDVLGVEVDALTKFQILQKIKNLLRSGKSIFIVTPYSEFLVAAQKDEKFREILNSADIALPDGIGILWAARFLSSTSPGLRPPSPGLGRGWGRGRIFGIAWNLFKSLAAIVFYPKYIRYPIPEKISGSEFIWDLAKLASENNYSIFLLGGFGNTPERVGERLKEKFPNLRIAGTYSGPFTFNPSPQAWGEEGREVEPMQSLSNKVVTIINNARADFLFVALGPKKQEKWIYENRQNLHCKLIIGLGGTFDYLANRRPYRPKFWAIRGLEWLWRLLTQPWRVGRILKGVWGLIWYCVKAKHLQ